MFDFQKRRETLLRSIKEKGVAGCLITAEISVRYLTGFTGDSTFLLLSNDQAILISDSRYDTQIRDECPGVEAVIRTAKVDMNQTVKQTVESAGLKSLLIESDLLSKSAFEKLQSVLPAIQWVDSTGLVQNQRAIKDEKEIELIEHSVTLAQRAFLAAKATLRKSQTEREVAFQMEHWIRDFGGQGRSFDMIVGVGARSALPHAGTTDTRLDEDSFVLFDWGADYQGYASDLTRVLMTGEVPAELEKIYGIVLEAQKAAIDQIRPGAEMVEIDSAARKVIADAGYDKFFGHGLGHGFGLEIHEQPRLSPVSTGQLLPGMVVTVEPGIYLPDFGGVRIEDDILVTTDGHRVLSDLPKEFDQMFTTLL